MPNVRPKFAIKSGAEDGTRTRDLLITNQLLYQLSYFGLKAERGNMPPTRDAASCSRGPVGREICHRPR